jgi:hypothetical protein
MKEGTLVLLTSLFLVVLTAYGLDKYSGAMDPILKSVKHDNGNVELIVWNNLGEGDQNYASWIFPFPGEDRYLYSSGFLVGTDCQGLIKVSSVAFYYWDDEFSNYVYDLFLSGTGGWPDWVPVFADLDSYVRCDDSEATENGPIGVEVERHGYSFSAPPKDDFIAFQYKIYNMSGDDLNNVYVSRFADFDVGGGMDYEDDLLSVDDTRDMPYMYDSDDTVPGYIGIICAQGTPMGSKAYSGAGFFPDYDAELFADMQNTTWETGDTANDYSFLHNTGPYEIPTGEYITVGFITVSGESLADLQANADVAMDSYQDDTGVYVRPASFGRIKAMYR